MESPHGDPYHPWGRACPRLPACACPRVRLPEQIGRTERGRKTGKTGRQGGQPDTLSRTGRTRASPDLASLAPTAHPAYPACLPCPPTLPASHARLSCPVSRHTHVCHIVNRSATRASLKTAFCQAILLFFNLSKRYALIHNNLRDS